MRINYVFTGEEEMDEHGRYIIPDDATHVSVHPSVKAIPEQLFYEHEHLVELICHDGVGKIGRWAFGHCYSLKRVVMLGVKVIEYGAFVLCEALTDIECRKLEIIGQEAFALCESLSNINLTSVKVVEEKAFTDCDRLVHVTFGKGLESIKRAAFAHTFSNSIERIIIPLKHGLITHDDIFTGCTDLRRVDLVERAELHETIDALLLEEWRDHMRKDIDSINQILPIANAGQYEEYGYEDEDEGEGDKARLIRDWIACVLYKINYYKQLHCNLLNDAATTLEHAVPKDIVMKHVLPFLELPSTDVLEERSRKRQRDEAF